MAYRSKLLSAALALGLMIYPTGMNAKAEAFEPVEFAKRFTIGMSFGQVQKALPKDSEQDVLSYIATENVFILNVDIPSSDKWSASFTFDTMDSPLRRPERLIELRCSAMLSSRNEPFDSLVRRVSTALGEPFRIERDQKKLLEAGWAISGDSFLVLEYSIIPGGEIGTDAVVDFIIRADKPNSSRSRLVA